MKRLLTLFTLILSLSMVFAAVDVTYTSTSAFGSVDSFEVMAYDCLDSGCNNVAPFSGVLLDGASTNNGTLMIRYPDNLATPYGYALFAVDSREEFRPLEFKVTAHSNGNPFVFNAESEFEFDKVTNCRSLVHDMSVLNEVKPNIPLVVSMNALLDAETVSAFRKVNNGIGYIPGALDDWYSAETQITLEIINDATGAVIHQETRELNLYADARERVDFVYVPRTEGRYHARIRSEVTDSACEIFTPQSSVKHFAVLEDEPADACYTLLNNLELSEAFPQEGQVVHARFNRLSNYANALGELFPVDTTLQVVVAGPQGEVVYEDFYRAPALADDFNPATEGFSFTAQNTGLHKVTVAGLADDFKCEDVPNTWEFLSTDVFVDTPLDDTDGDGDTDDEQPDIDDIAFAVHFFIQDSETLEPIQDAKVRLVENGFQDESNSNGVATIDDLVNGVYTFKVTSDLYESFTGVVIVNDEDQSVLVSLDEDRDADDDDSDSASLAVGSIRMPAASGVRPGETLQLVVNFDNDGGQYLDDARATVTILALGVYDTSGPFDVKEGDSTSKRLLVDIPSWAPAGDYHARITVGSGKDTRVLYRPVRVLA